MDPNILYLKRFEIAFFGMWFSMALYIFRETLFSIEKQHISTIARPEILLFHALMLNYNYS